jgi:hypothetical protein
MLQHGVDKRKLKQSISSAAQDLGKWLRSGYLTPPVTRHILGML